MTEHELNRAIQYVTASTSYGREVVAAIIRTGLAELVALATLSQNREVLFEYVCRWTMKKTDQPEPMVREVLGGAGRWLDQEYERLAQQQPALLKNPGQSMS